MKAFQGPALEGCDVAMFIQAEICPSVSSIPSFFVPQWKKFNHVISKDKTKTSFQNFYFTLKLRPLEPMPSAVGQGSY